MKNKKVKIIINLILIVITLLFVFSTNVRANSINDWISQGNKFVNQGKGNSTINESSMRDTILPIGRALVAIGTVVLVVVTVIMGIKYMMCGSADEKAKLKTQLIGLVVATIVIFGAQVIWSTLYNAMNNLTSN